MARLSEHAGVDVGTRIADAVWGRPLSRLLARVPASEPCTPGEMEREEAEDVFDAQGAGVVDVRVHVAREVERKKRDRSSTLRRKSAL